tara:strand:- start:7905 stop:8072 length:168 start_codon:yes stop_codon:yes gene_type:complete
MQDEASEEVNLKPKARAERLARDKAARSRRKELKAVREKRLLNEFARMRRARQKG